MVKQKLTTKQKKFVKFYDGNGKEAARKAGYKGNNQTLSSVATENLNKPYIAEAIKQRHKKEDNVKILDRQGRQELWTKIANEEKNDLGHRLTALRDLGRSEGDFIDRLKVEGELTINRKSETELDESLQELNGLIKTIKSAIANDPSA